MIRINWCEEEEEKKERGKVARVRDKNSLGKRWKKRNFIFVFIFPRVIASSSFIIISLPHRRRPLLSLFYVYIYTYLYILYWRQQPRYWWWWWEERKKDFRQKYLGYIWIHVRWWYRTVKRRWATFLWEFFYLSDNDLWWNFHCVYFNIWNFRNLETKSWNSSLPSEKIVQNFI